MRQLILLMPVVTTVRQSTTSVFVATWFKVLPPILHMTYRHHSLRCHHRVQNAQGSNEHQLRITCQECQGHLAIVYGRHLTAESRRLMQQHLEGVPQPRARAAAATREPQDEPDPSTGQEDIPEDVEEHRVRLIRSISELNQMMTAMNQEVQKLTAELEESLRQETPPPQAPNPPEETPKAQGSPQQQRPHP